MPLGLEPRASWWQIRTLPTETQSEPLDRFESLFRLERQFSLLKCEFVSTFLGYVWSPICSLGSEFAVASTAEGHIAAWGGQLPPSQRHSVPKPSLLASGGCDSSGFRVCMLGHRFCTLGTTPTAWASHIRQPFISSFSLFCHDRQLFYNATYYSGISLTLSETRQNRIARRAQNA